jgi:hypothetical protein
MLRRTTGALGQHRTRGRCCEVVDEWDSVYAHAKTSEDDKSALENVGRLTVYICVGVNEKRPLEAAVGHVCAR